MRARALWLKVHLYLGLFVGALLALQGLTGSLLVFDEELDRLLNPQLATSTGDGPRISADRVIAIVEERYQRRPYYLQLPTEVSAYVAFIDADDPTSDQRYAISVAAEDGRILAQRSWGGYFASFVRELHSKLLLGEAGKLIIGTASLLALVSILTGLYLWWPRAGSLRRALVFRWRQQALAASFEIHRTTGCYLAVVLLVIVFAGTYLALPGPFAGAVGALLPMTQEPEGLVSRPPQPDAHPLSLDDVERAVQRDTPGATITSLQLPGPDEPYVVYYRDPAESYSRFGRSTLWVDQYDGRILDARRYAQLHAADRYLLSQVLIHNGQIAGPVGRCLALLAGLALPTMYGTGLFLWWRRRRVRLNAAARLGM